MPAKASSAAKPKAAKSSTAVKASKAAAQAEGFSFTQKKRFRKNLGQQTDALELPNLILTQKTARLASCGFLNFMGRVRDPISLLDSGLAEPAFNLTPKGLSRCCFCC